MSFLAPKSTLALFILQDDALKVLVHKTSEGDLRLPVADAVPVLDRDLAFTCRRIVKNVAGGMDCHLHPVSTLSGVSSAEGWGVNQIWAGIARAEDLPDNLGPDALFVKVDALVDVIGVDVDDEEEDEEALADIHPDDYYILATVRADLQGRAHLSKFPAMLLPREFTLPEMKRAYEIVSGMPIDDSSFRRKVEFLQITHEVGERRGTSRRPAKTYRLVGARMEFERSLVFADRT